MPEYPIFLKYNKLDEKYKKLNVDKCEQQKLPNESHLKTFLIYSDFEKYGLSRVLV